MDDSKSCKIKEGCKLHFCGIFGVILIVLATILTFVTASSLGILGMFFVGIMLCCHKKMSSCKMPYGCRCCCPCDETSCDTVAHEKTEKN